MATDDYFETDVRGIENDVYLPFSSYGLTEGASVEIDWGDGNKEIIKSCDTHPYKDDLVKSLKKIPGRFFAHNRLATDFYGTFFGCDGLSDLPDKIFWGRRDKRFRADADLSKISRSR